MSILDFVLKNPGTANGTCFAQEVGPVLGMSIYAKDGSVSKLALPMNSQRTSDLGLAGAFGFDNADISRN